MIAGAQSEPLSVDDLGAVSEARRAVEALAGKAGLDPSAQSRAAIVATELLTNAVRHGGGTAYCFLRQLGGGKPAIELSVVDRGPGMANFEHSMRDGVSTGGSAGEGLGAIARQADEFAAWTMPGRGAAFMARIGARDAGGPEALPCGMVNTPLAQPPSGDAVSMRETAGAVWLLAVDGLGHGELAAEAAREAVRIFHEAGDGESAEAVLQLIHGALMKTRGAAGALAVIPRSGGALRFCGVGNISGTVFANGRRQGMVSHNGILGHQLPRMHANDYPCPAGAVIVMHSDGIGSHWSLDDYPGLAGRHPALIAALLWRDHRRARDDASVLVVRRPG